MADLHLVQQHAPGRWRLHDLIKLYAAERARQDLAAADRDAALTRLLDFFLHTAHAADRLLEPHRNPIRPADPGPGHQPQRLDGEAAALEWFSVEHPVLLAMQQVAVLLKLHDRVWQLAWTLDTFHHRRGHLHDAVTAWRAGLAAAERDDDPSIRVLAHRLLGGAATYTGLHDEAVEHLSRSLDLAERSGDRTAQAHTHRVLAQACEQRGDDRRALGHATRALELYRGLGLTVWEAGESNAVGWYLARLGDHESAREHCEAALRSARLHDDPGDEADALDSLGFIAHRTGRFPEALDHYRQALARWRRRVDTFEEADTLDRLGHTHRAVGDHGEARTAWRRARDLYQAQHRTQDAQRVQRLLDELRGPGQHAL